MRYRYASAFGDHHALPEYFMALSQAQRHKLQCDDYNAANPYYHESMRIEECANGEWVPYP